MNALQQDIISVIRKHGASRTVEICEDLLEFGYGGTMSFDDFKTHIGKTISKLKSEGHVVGEDRPNPGTKPARYWSLPEADHLEDKLEMASDVVESFTDVLRPEAEKAFERMYPEQAPEQRMNDFLLDKLKECTEWKKRLPSKPMSATDIMREYWNDHEEGDLSGLPGFILGIAAAERHHGIVE